MKSWKEQAKVACVFNKHLDKGLLCSEVLLQQEDTLHAAPLVI